MIQNIVLEVVTVFTHYKGGFWGEGAICDLDILSLPAGGGIPSMFYCQILCSQNIYFQQLGLLQHSYIFSCFASESFWLWFQAPGKMAIRHLYTMSNTQKKNWGGGGFLETFRQILKL